MNKYEAIIIFRESLKDTDWDGAVEVVSGEITKLGGQMTSCTRMGKREFARVMQKQTGGHYGMMTLQLDGDKVTPLLARLKLNEQVFRMQVLSAPKVSNTQAKGADDGVAE